MGDEGCWVDRQLENPAVLASYLLSLKKAWRKYVRLGKWETARACMLEYNRRFHESERRKSAATGT